jgi:hypothetical protein
MSVAVNGLRAEGLRVVESAECFDAKLQGFRFRQTHILRKAKS